MSRAYNTPPRVQSWHFHWRFWAPKECNGGPVRFGLWAKVAGWVTYHLDARTDIEQEVYKEWDMSAEQVAVKRDLGLIQP